MLRAASFAGLVAAVLWTVPVFAHGGGLNACGCHINSKTGEYHCHRDTGKKDCTPKKPKKSRSKR